METNLATNIAKEKKNVVSRRRWMWMFRNKFQQIEWKVENNPWRKEFESSTAEEEKKGAEITYNIILWIDYFTLILR